MEFKVPKYLERESSIAFGLTFKKLGVLGALGMLCFFLYYVLPKIIFAFVAATIGGAFFIFAFVRIQDQSMLELVSYAVNYFISQRIFFWQKTTGLAPIKVVKKKAKILGQDTLKIAPKSQLSELRSKIDIGEV